MLRFCVGFCLVPERDLLFLRWLVTKLRRQEEGLPRFMFSFLDRIPYSILIVIATLMLLAPFRPMPHVVEKLMMLKNGNLTRPIDIFDLFFHLIPTILVILKIMRSLKKAA
jgi:hypothetical protein